GASPVGVTEGALEVLCAYGWPGNVRELRSVMRRAVLFANGGEIGVDELPHAELDARRRLLGGEGSEPPKGDAQRISEALALSGGNQTEAAKLLGISRRTLSKRLDRLGIKRPRKRG
ncbi:MAG: helix-turn-helix domain-containing protein, partial [Myxococcota bacterium]